VDCFMPGDIGRPRLERNRPLCPQLRPPTSCRVAAAFAFAIL